MTKILIVEDEPLIGLDVAFVLAQDGFEVIGPATSVGAAISLLRAAKPAAALLDIKLRDETSEQVINELRALEVPFIVVTGYSTSRPAEFTGIETIDKPIDYAKLLDKLRRIAKP